MKRLLPWAATLMLIAALAPPEAAARGFRAGFHAVSIRGAGLGHPGWGWGRGWRGRTGWAPVGVAAAFAAAYEPYWDGYYQPPSSDPCVVWTGHGKGVQYSRDCH